VEPVQIGASFLGFEVCSGISIGCYADTSPYCADQCSLLYRYTVQYLTLSCC